MDPDRWQRLSPLLDALLELDADARAERLQRLRAEDADLAGELQRLIALEEAHADFLAEPLVGPPAGLRPGGEVGPYRLERLLGEGGMGQVWLAARADGLYQRRVALKLLRPGLADHNLRLRFSREREILARLAHPHIARLLDAGVSAEGVPYLALEYVEGEPISDYCRNRQVPLEARLRMFQQICDAVSHAHANLIVHRDLKPSNILVTPGGDVRLLDFGIAKLLDSDAPMIERTRTGMRAFTLHYAAPEQVRGEPVTTMTDVYSLGVVLYELLTDTKPYRLKRQTDAEWEEAILAADPTRPSLTVLRRGEEEGEADAATLRRLARALSGDLDNIVLKTLSKRPEQRYPSVEALALDLQRYQAGRPVLARPQSWSYRLGKYLRRHRWALATGTLVATVLAVSLATVAWQARQAVQEAGRAQAMQDFMVGVFESARGTPEGQALDLRGLLDASLARGDRELARQPRARAELLGVIARLRIGLGDYREALTLLERQAAILRGLDDAPVSLQLESLTQRGQALRLLGEPRRCIELMQPALATARREQAQLPPQASEFYSQLGRCRREDGELQGARQLFERALAVRREDRDAVGAVENLMDLAQLQADAGQTAAALQGFEQARAQLTQTVGERHALQVEIGRQIADLRRELDQVDAAEREAADSYALALEVYGAQHPSTLALRRQLAQLHIAQGRFADAQNELREVLGQLLQRRDRQRGNPELEEVYRQLGLLAWERGDAPRALTLLQRALAIARENGDGARVADSLYAYARVLHGSGRQRSALAALNEAGKLREARFGAGHPLLGDVARLRGQVEVALGRHDQGLALLQRAVALTRAGYGAAHPRTRLAELALARQLARDGETDDAVARLRLLAGLPTQDPELRRTAWRAQAYLAQLRCAAPEEPPDARTEAQTELDALLETLREQQPDGGLVTREVEAIRRGCG
ncbi:serine/threonine-protein kinase [Vulcaniibacterium tengchongense]|uniref:Serine/threonine-protein kinase n=1 Tax=Vulcaniibacterium tengchongense TaxID=1273429 RepID=A0A3N4VL82_9GAMM|nr:serine/threonine-protein kinase [Vulcaniibacterium tengchongense]RPE80021.1 serine/threonine-protein kinase [Vulcaniibacterium tengchongense]